MDDGDPLPPPDVPGLVRRVRRVADLSQRELARATGLSSSRINRIENGQTEPPVSVLVTIAALARARLALICDDGTELEPMSAGAVTDQQRRRFPAHLDVRHGDEDWWGIEHHPYRRQPRYTFGLDRSYRDGRRNRGSTPSDHPEPQPGDSLEERAAARRRAAEERRRERVRRLRDAGLLPPPEPEWTCCCPAGCEVLLLAEEKVAHVAGCPCRCDVC